MSDATTNSRQRRDLLKQLILDLHKGEDSASVRARLIRLLGQVPYGDVVHVEQELIAEGLPSEEILRLCDVHSAVLQGKVDLTGMKEVPPGHPVYTFSKENEAIQRLLADLEGLFAEIESLPATGDAHSLLGEVRGMLNLLWDVDKHYRRKEYLLFPYLEKQGITGPPTVMWSKHDQIRGLLRSAVEALEAKDIGVEEAGALVQLVLRPAAQAVADMIVKESQILFPLCLDVVAETEWFEIAERSPEIGYCLYDPRDRWVPAEVAVAETDVVRSGRVIMPTGSFSLPELTAMLNTMPVDITFVDQDDTVRYFSAGSHRIFDRNRTILGRKVQYCHPPSSVHVVNRILDDFRSGRQNRAEFWITLQGRFIYISYYAVRDEQNQYLGTVEVSMDLTQLRALQGEKRLLSYESEGETARA